MKIISPNVELIQQEPDGKGLFKHIERCGRTCYKSEDKITDDSSAKFVYNLIDRQHLAMLEHGTVYLILKINNNNRRDLLIHWGFNPDNCNFMYATDEVAIEDFYKPLNN